MEIIDNVNRLLGDELKSTIGRESKLRIAASTFSIYAFEALRDELEGIESLEFIFTSPTFVTGVRRLPGDERRRREDELQRLDALQLVAERLEGVNREGGRRDPKLGLAADGAFELVA